MHEFLSFDQARTRDWDVIIAGSSFSAMFFLKGLPRGLKVLIIEKGPHLPLQDQIDLNTQNRDLVAQENSSGHEKDWVFHTILGGNSNCWWACTPRFHPNDFRLHSLYGVGEDWPIGYDDLAPFYDEVEQVMEINGGGSDRVLPRKMPFPYPPHLPSRSDRKLRAHSDLWWAQPSARSNGGDRGGCCTNGVCQKCPVDAKFTMLNSADRFTYPGAYLLLESEVRAVRIEGARATGVSVRHGERDAELSAPIVALGTNAVFNAAILLRSGLEHPNLGRGLNEQLGQTILVDGPGLGYYGGTSITGHGYPLYDGAHRADHSGVLIEVYNAPASLRQDVGKWTERVALKLIVEDLPREDNRVILEGDAPKILWSGHHDYAWDGLAWGRAQLPRILPSDLTIAKVGTPVRTEAHAMGTHRFGNDPRRHVVAPDHRVHGVDGLYALGSGVFPATSPANPTLTLSALALRAGRTLA